MSDVDWKACINFLQQRTFQHNTDFQAGQQIATENPLPAPHTSPASNRTATALHGHRRWPALTGADGAGGSGGHLEALREQQAEEDDRLDRERQALNTGANNKR